MDGDLDRYKQSWDRALGLLSRREYSEYELYNKLLVKGAKGETAAAVVGELKRRGHVSDQRFTESYVRSRMERGDGPLKIRHELKARGVAEALVGEHLDLSDDQWEAVLANVRSKKFGADMPGDYKQWAKQARFLQSRGFTSEQIRKAVIFQEHI